VTSPDTFQLLRRRTLTIWLHAQTEDYWNRVAQQGDRRPLDEHPQARAEFRRLLAVREPLYAQAAHALDTSHLSVDEAVKAIAGLVGNGAQAEASK